MAGAAHEADLNMLEWHLEQGVTDVLENQPVNKLQSTIGVVSIAPEISDTYISVAPKKTAPPAQPEMPLGTSDAKKEALRLAQVANTLEELASAIKVFDGLAIRKTATNMVFSDGNAKSPIMVIGEAPGGDEDIQGKPFVGASGQLLDRMFSAIGLDRHEEDPAKAFYISNILNWRPPGNRTPSTAEIDISLPFIERHIALVKPKLLVFMGGVAAKALLNTDEGITKIRGKWSTYSPLNEIGGESLPCLPTFHPSFLLRAPIQKKLAWTDMLLLKEKLGS